MSDSLKHQIQRVAEQFDRESKDAVADNVQPGLPKEVRDGRRVPIGFVLGVAAAIAVVVLIAVAISRPDSPSSELLAAGGETEADLTATAAGDRLEMSLRTDTAVVAVGGGEVGAVVTLRNPTDDPAWYGSATCGYPLGAVALEQDVQQEVDPALADIARLLVNPESTFFQNVELGDKFCSAGLSSVELPAGQTVEFSYVFPGEGGAGFAATGPSLVRGSIEEFTGPTPEAEPTVIEVSVPLLVTGSADAPDTTRVEVAAIVLDDQRVLDLLGEIGIDSVVFGELAREDSGWLVRIGSPDRYAEVRLSGDPLEVQTVDDVDPRTPATSPP